MAVYSADFYLPRQQGIDGADLASRILKGEKTITNVPLQYHATRPIFDWAQIKRLKIEKSTLPENSYIYNIPTYEEIQNGNHCHNHLGVCFTLFSDILVFT